MRICLYTETALPQVGGQEMVVDTLARTYQVLGHEAVVLAPQPHSPYQTMDESLPYPVVRHPRFFSSRYLVSWYRYFLVQLWKRRPCDVLHCHGLFPPGYLAALARANLHAPVVLTSHGGDLHPDNIRLRKPGVKERVVHGLKGADALVAISRFTREGYRRLCPDVTRVVDIPNGVDLDALTTAAPRPARWDPAIVPGQYLLFLGRLRHRKGVDVLLRALASVPDQGKVQLVIAGEGTERRLLETMAAELGVARRVRFVGGVAGDYKNYLLQNALCGVVPSRIWEAFPLVVLEMFAAGKAVIGTHIPGLEDLIEDATGWSVPSESPEVLGRALAEALTHPEQTRQRGEAAQHVAMRFDWTNIAERHLELYAELVARQRRLPVVSYARVRVEQAPGARRDPAARASEAVPWTDGL
jgi:glycosyltransferase involved in cell wall biosynthesis